MERFVLDVKLWDGCVKVEELDLCGFVRDISMNELVVSNSFCDEVMYRLQWTHPKQLIVRAFVAHWNSIVGLKIKVNEASLLSFVFRYFEVLLFPAFADPANTLVIHRLIRGMSVVIFDYIDGGYSLDEASADRNGDVSIFLLYGMQVSFEIDEAKVALIVKAVYRVVVLQNFGDFAGVYFIDFAKGDIEMD